MEELRDELPLFKGLVDSRIPLGLEKKMGTGSEEIPASPQQLEGILAVQKWLVDSGGCISENP